MKSVLSNQIVANLVNAHRMHELPVLQVMQFIDAIEAAVKKAVVKEAFENQSSEPTLHWTDHRNERQAMSLRHVQQILKVSP